MGTAWQAAARAGTHSCASFCAHRMESCQQTLYCVASSWPCDLDLACAPSLRCQRNERGTSHCSACNVSPDGSPFLVVVVATAEAELGCRPCRHISVHDGGSHEPAWSPALCE